MRLISNLAKNFIAFSQRQEVLDSFTKMTLKVIVLVWKAQETVSLVVYGIVFPRRDVV